jgi:hypothetical protein
MARRYGFAAIKIDRDNPHDTMITIWPAPMLEVGLMQVDLCRASCKSVYNIYKRQLEITAAKGVV